MPPFRNLIGGDGDPPEEDWTPPDYAKPIETKSAEDWKPPEYAKAVKEKSKPSEFKARAGRAVGDFVKDVKSIPAAASKFVEDHPYIRQVGQRFLTGESTEDTAARENKGADFGYGPRWDEKTQKYSGPPKGLGYLGPLKTKDGGTMGEYSIDGEINGKSVQYPSIVPTLTKDEVTHLLNMKEDDKMPDSISKKAATHAKLRIDAGKDPFAQIGEQRLDLHPDLERNPTPKRVDTPQSKPIGEELQKIPGLETAGNWIRNKAVNTGNWALGAAGSLVGSAVGSAAIMADPRAMALHDGEPPIRQSKEIPYRMADDAKTPAKTAEIPIKQTTKAVKEVPKDAELPKELEAYDKKQNMAQPQTDEQLTKGLKTPIKSSSQDLADRLSEIVKDKRPKMPDSELAKTQFGMKSPFEASPELETKSAEESQVKQPRGTTISMLGAGQGENLLRIARETGEDIRNIAKRLNYDPTEEELNDLYKRAGRAGIVAGESQVKQPPSAKYMYDWPDMATETQGPEQYQIKGGRLDGSSVGADTLRKEGIEIPEKTAEAIKPDARKPISEWKPPDYAKAVETPRTSEEDLTKGFGGSGHPESADYVSKVLNDAGKGDAGLKIEDKEGFKHIVYRNQKGEPIAAAKIVTGPDGKSMIQDIAADKSKGLLTGRAMKAIGDKLNELGATESSGTTSSDAQNFLAKMKDRMSDAAAGKPEEPVLMHGGLGFTGSSTVKQPSVGPHAAVLDKLFASLEESKGLTDVQSQMYKSERAKRFSEFAGVRETGSEGAAKSLSKLKGQYEKIEPLYGKLQLEPQETDQLFTAVKKANITEGEKARGYTALFKLMNGESVPQRGELAILDDVFGNGFASRITEMHGGLGAVGLKLSKVANTMKSLQNSISLAAPLRHGIGLVARKEFAPAFGEMFKYFAKPEYYSAAMDALEKRPNYLLGREAGLFTSKPNSLMNSEEEFLNSYVGAIPGVKQAVGASQRAYSGFLNKLRSDTFDSMIKQAKDLGHDISTTVGDQAVPSKETKAIARYINNATGRGDLPGGLNKITNELNLLLWSPRMISSRINMLANPKIYTDLPKGMRLDGLKSLLGIATLGTTIDTLGAYAGAKVSTNILSTDAGKPRFGKDLIDPWGGFQQYVVGAARFLAGKTDSNTPTSRLDIAGRFLANKESPAASLAHVLLTAKKFTGKSDDPETAGNFTNQYGQKTNIQSEIGKRFTPIFIQDLQELVKSQPEWSENIGLTAIMTGASLAGMSQNYAEKKKLGFRSMKP